MKLSALCCGCGNLAVFGSKMKLGGKHAGSGPHVPWEGYLESDFVRCVIQRWCVVCQTATTHAFLRGDDDEYRDTIETTHRERCIDGLRSETAGHPVSYCHFCVQGVVEQQVDRVLYG